MKKCNIGDFIYDVDAKEYGIVVPDLEGESKKYKCFRKVTRNQGYFYKSCHFNNFKQVTPKTEKLYDLFIELYTLLFKYENFHKLENAKEIKCYLRESLKKYGLVYFNAVYSNCKNNKKRIFKENELESGHSYICFDLNDNSIHKFDYYGYGTLFIDKKYIKIWTEEQREEAKKLFDKVSKNDKPNKWEEYDNYYNSSKNNTEDKIKGYLYSVSNSDYYCCSKIHWLKYGEIYDLGKKIEIKDKTVLLNNNSITVRVEKNGLYYVKQSTSISKNSNDKLTFILD